MILLLQVSQSSIQLPRLPSEAGHTHHDLEGSLIFVLEQLTKHDHSHQMSLLKRYFFHDSGKNENIL